VDLIVRPATVDDGAALLAMMPRLAAFDLPEGRNPEHLWMHDAAMLEHWLEEQQDDCRVHVAERDGEIIAFTMVSLRPEMLSKAPSAHLEAIAVAAGCEGSGVAARLLEAAERDARSCGAQSMTLHVFARNARARRFYEKSGYDGEILRYTKPLSEDGTAA